MVVYQHKTIKKNNVQNYGLQPWFGALVNHEFLYIETIEKN